MGSKGNNSEIKISLHKPYSTDGIELDSILFEPLKPTKKIIIHIHGKEGHFIQNHFVTVLGNTLPESGYAFLTFNNRGHDYMADLIRKTTTGFIWEQGGSAFDILEDCIFDIQGVVNYVEDFGFSEIILEGHSLDPHKISYYIVNNPNHHIKKVIFLSPGDTLYALDSSVPRWSKYSELAKEMIDKGKGKEIMPVRLWSNCPASANTFWDYTKDDSNLFVFNGTHPEIEYRNFNKLKLPILVVCPENDFATGIKQEKNMALMKERTVSRNFQAVIMKNAVHNFLGKEEELADVIIRWLSMH